jgi:hypothetical protein
MHQTAELVRARLLEQPELELLAAAGISVTFDHSRRAVWLEVAGRVVSRIDWIRWWEPGRATREAHAGWIAHRLLVEWMRGQGKRQAE